VYGLLAFAPGVHPLVSTIWLGFTYSIAAVSKGSQDLSHFSIQSKPTKYFSFGWYYLFTSLIKWYKMQANGRRM